MVVIVALRDAEAGTQQTPAAGHKELQKNRGTVDQYL